MFLAPGRASDGQRVDRIRLAALARAATSIGHQVGRHAQHRLAGPDQIGFQASREMPAVLKRPPPLRPPRRPLQRGEMPGRGRRHRDLRPPPAAHVGCDQRVRALVRVHADHDPLLTRHLDLPDYDH